MNNPQAQHLECEDWFLCSRQIPGEAKAVAEGGRTECPQMFFVYNNGRL